MRRLLHAATATAALAAAAATATVASAAGPSELQITEASAQFPARAYVLTLPHGRRLRSSGVVVTENRHRVVDLKVVPEAAASQTGFGTVLAIDASNSMRGAPIRDAINAARAFVQRRNLNQKLAVVTFTGTTKVTVPFTTSQNAITSGLAGVPRTAEGTRIYDAVSQGIALLQAAGVRAGSIVVLSDGADTGSQIKLAPLIERAQAAHVRVFTVGLRSNDFRPAPLRQLARETGGSFSDAGSGTELRRIYRDLGLQLTREYLLTYHSAARPGAPVHVVVTVSGFGKASAGYATPALRAPGGVAHGSSIDGIWRSPLTMLFVVLIVLGLIALAVLPLVRRRGNAGLRGRVSDYVTLPREQADPAVSKIFTGTERSLERTRWWGRFKADLEFADIKIPAVQVVVATLVCTLFAMWLFSQVAGPLFLVGLGIPLVVRAIIRGRFRRVQRMFADQLPDNLDVLSSALRAGHSLVGALAAVVNNAPDPSRREFQRAVADEQFGVPLSDALLRVAERMNSRDVEQVALVAGLQSETGGNAAEVLDRVTEGIRERAELRRLIRVLTAQGRLARWIVSLLPVGLLVLISTLSSAYIKPLFTHNSGRVMLTIAGLMIVAGSVVIGRIVDIDV